MAQATQFWNKIAEKYSQQPIADEAAYQKKLAVTRDYFRPDMEVLEIGCGTGSTAILHRVVAPYQGPVSARNREFSGVDQVKGKLPSTRIP
jgi:ubiquinone/menaquinone biosynthesis C-methylase UbiE